LGAGFKDTDRGRSLERLPSLGRNCKKVSWAEKKRMNGSKGADKVVRVNAKST